MLQPPAPHEIVHMSKGMVMIVSISHLWLAQNDVRNGEAMRHPHSVAAQIKAYVEMIELHLFGSETSTRRDSTLSSARWTPPPEGTVCVNVDATLFTSSRQMVTGVVI